MITVIPVRFLPGNQWVHIRDLCGKDEQSVNGTRSIDAISLLKRLIQNNHEESRSISNPALLPVPDRDQVLMAVYINTYGSKIETSVTCHSCKKKFDISFSLDDWMEGPSFAEFPSGHLDEEFPFKSSENIPFRLPTGEDELAVLGMDPEVAEHEILKRCIPPENTGVSEDSLQKAMQETAPLVDREFEVQCPECVEMQRLHFNLQQYLLNSLMNSVDNLSREVHLLAKSYGWGLNEIMELPRSLRKSYISNSTS